MRYCGKKVSKGFTLLEALIVTVVFGALMSVIFYAMNSFQKASLKAGAKQDINGQIARIYRDINKNVSGGTAIYFEFYDNGSNHDISSINSNKFSVEKRWFVFPVSRVSNSSQMNYTGNIIYNKMILYFLYYPGCCNGFNNCPHKSLYRRTYDCYITGGVALRNPMKNLASQSVLESKMSLSDWNGLHKVDEGIVDLTVSQRDDIITFNLTLLRLEDAARHIDIGTKNLVSPDQETKKYLETISWNSVPENT